MQPVIHATDVPDAETTLQVDGMTCANCALGITRYLENLGLKHVYVNFATGEVQFDNTGRKDLHEISAGIQRLGYTVVSTQPRTDGDEKHSRISSLEWKFLICLLFTLPLLSAMILPFPLLHRPYFQLILCIPVYLTGVYHFGKSALASLKTGIPNMDLLIFTGSSAAFLYSLWGTLFHMGTHYAFYETAAAIITIVLLGNVFEHRSVRQTSSAISDLQRLQPAYARRIHYEPGEGKQHISEVAADALQVRDQVLVNSGDKIPLDGIVVSGEGWVDESMLSGESMPVLKKKGDAVTGSTILAEGNLVITISAGVQNSTLAGIIALVKKAQADKPPVQRMADKVSAWFVPIVTGIALLTFVLTRFAANASMLSAISNSIAVLVIACPCAMGLATPTAVMVGLGRSAKKGILIKGASTLEQFAKTEIIVFDKTGTLTSGDFTVSGLKVYTGKEEDLFTVIHALESRSSHPIASSLLRAFPDGEKNFVMNDIREEKSLGMSGYDAEGNLYLIGSAAMAPGKVKLPAHDIYVFKNDVLLAGFEIRDVLKPQAAEMIAYFRKRNIRTILLSGDKEEKTRAVAEALHMDGWYSSQKPADKIRCIEELAKKNIVAMVGDGINDSPSLERAHVGISMSNASQIALNSAQMILLNGNLGSLSLAHHLGCMTMQTIRQNLFWAFFYNAAAIPVAALGFLNPMVAAFSMAFSDLFVVGNSVRLRSRKIR